MTLPLPLPSPSPAPGAAPRALPGRADTDARPTPPGDDAAAAFAALALATDGAGVPGADAGRAEPRAATIAGAGEDAPRRPPSPADADAPQSRKAGVPWPGLHLLGHPGSAALGAAPTLPPQPGTARPLTDLPMSAASAAAAPEAARGETAPAPNTQVLAGRAVPGPPMPLPVPPPVSAATVAEPGFAPSSPAPETTPATPSPAPLLREAPVPALAAKPVAAPPEPAQQLARAVAHAPAERVVEVRLDPPHLGRVRIEFDFSGEAVRAVVSAAEPEALALLRRGGAGLARDLADMGYAGADIEYDQAGDRADGAGRDEPAGRAFALPVPTEEPGPGPARARAAYLHDGALDITL